VFFHVDDHSVDHSAMNMREYVSSFAQAEGFDRIAEAKVIWRKSTKKEPIAVNRR